MSLKKIMELPLSDLRKILKEFVDVSIDFWELHLGNNTDEPQEFVAEEKNQLPPDIKAVIETNKAIAEKYQASQSESLLKHLGAKLASERGLTGDQDIAIAMDELKEVLYVDEKYRNIMSLHPSERVSHIADKVISENEKLIRDIYDGKNEAIDKFKQIVDEECGELVSKRDVMLKAQYEINNKYFKQWDSENNKEE